MKLLFLDIESSPSQAFVWGLFDQNVGINQVIDSSKVLCYSAKWHGKKEKMVFDSVHQSSEKTMLKGVHKLLDEADVIATYNGTSFDLPVLNREFLLQKMAPPSPYKQVDLLRVARRQFRFLSNKMDYVAQALGVGNKTRHPGFQLWIDCMAGDEKAWKLMEKYNRQDVILLEGIYEKMLPWIPGHPSHGVYTHDLVCPNCGGKKLQRRGTQVNASGRYQRFQCECGKWMHSAEKEQKGSKDRMIGIH